MKAIAGVLGYERAPSTCLGPSWIPERAAEQGEAADRDFFPGLGLTTPNFLSRENIGICQVAAGSRDGPSGAQGTVAEHHTLVGIAFAAG